MLHFTELAMLPENDVLSNQCVQINQNENITSVLHRDSRNIQLFLKNNMPVN